MDNQEGAASAVDFLRSFHPARPWVLTAIEPDTRAIETRTFLPEEADAAAEWIRVRDGKRNLYFSVNEVSHRVSKKASKADIKAAHYLHVDLDARAGEPLKSELRRLNAIGGDRTWPRWLPSRHFKIFSGGGYQLFWRLREPVPINGDTAAAEDFERYNKAIALALGGDNCHNVDRIMRLPGTLNIPDEKKRKRGREPTRAKIVGLSSGSIALADVRFPTSTNTPVGAPSSPAVAVVLGELARIDSSDALDAHVDPRLHEQPRYHRLKVLMLHGHDPVDPRKDDAGKDGSGSGWTFDFAANALRAGVAPELIVGILTDERHAISRHCRAQKNPRRAAERAVQNATKEGARPGEWLQEDVIAVRGGELISILDQAEAALTRAGAPVYQRGESLVRTARLDTSTDAGGVRRAGGSVVLVEVSRNWLVEQFARCATWIRVDKEGRPSKIDPPPKYAGHYIDRVGEWRMPVLLGITHTPTLRPDGSILQTPGYDEASRLIYDPCGAVFPPIPDAPTRDDAAAALERVGSLFQHFPFVDEAARSVALAALLTAIVRRGLRTAPLFAIDAPTAGTGKTLIAETIGVIATGHVPAMMSQGKSAEEDEKRLSTLLMAGDPLIVIDNCDLPLEGDFLCSMLTQEMVQARILGRSERVRLPSNALVIATGNNLTLAGDVTRRAVLCRLDARVERPDTRQFTVDPRREAMARRPELVADCLTVLRAYIAAGHPAPLDRIGSFEDWNIVREPLVWLGCADPAETRRKVLANDPRKAELMEILHAWRACFGSSERTLADVRTHWQAAPDDEVRGLLHNLLVDLTNRPQFNPRSVGRHLKRYVDRVVAGMVLRSREAKAGLLWRVDGVGDQPKLDL